ncbi:nucleotide exchange factor GrpE [Syntrophaceticus schinkii]|uniref:Protein GrpE n=1 Tax=Syntrophaceticus schinkii TaxID=499207 RepID=A0A0B7MKU0_9FIRM|nr:nucleotide exchange factor GrpE [Syntrophaceticus schinkii]CEO88272.1 Protein GrpE [Syntrophaceticus schinkii]
MLNSDQDLQEQGVSPENGEEVTAETEGSLEEETEVIEEAEDAKADLEAEFNNLQQRFLRLTADFDNYRRRTRQENAEIRRTANERLLLDIIPIIDNFERALDAAKKELPENIITGIEMIYRQLHNLLSQEGVEPVESVGKPFDPVYQDAFERIETTEYPEGTVTAEVQKGYLLHGKVLRPALVIVAKKPETEIKTQKKILPKGGMCR